jgi:opacity protein-like surface antigen
MGGAAMPMGDLDDGVKAGFTVGGGVEFGISALPFGVRADVGYTKFGRKSASFDVFGETISGRSEGSNLGVTVNAMFAPRVSAAQIRPYATAGLGFYNSSSDQEYVVGTDRVAFDDSKGSLGFNGGAGVRFQFVGFSSFVEARYHHILKGRAEISEESEEFEWKSAAYVPIVFGITIGG